MILAKDKTVEELIAVMIEHGLEARWARWADMPVQISGLPPHDSATRAKILRAMGLPKEKLLSGLERYYNPSIFPDGFVEAALLLTELKQSTN